jgi:hypothetical protein
MKPAFAAAPCVGVSAFALAASHTCASAGPVRATTTTTTMMLGGFFNRRLRSPSGLGGGKKKNDGMGGKGAGRDSGGLGSGSGGSGLNKFLSGLPGFGGGSNPLTSALAAYRHKLSSFPIVTQVLTSFIGFAVSTLIVDAHGSVKDLDWVHVASNGALGAIIHGLVGHYYYPYAEQVLPGVGVTALVGKTVGEFVIWLPFVTAAHRALHRAIGRGSGPKDAWECIKEDGWQVPAPIWIAWSLLMFKVVPAPAERVLTYNIIVAGTALGQRLFGIDVEKVERVSK